MRQRSVINFCFQTEIYANLDVLIARKSHRETRIYYTHKEYPAFLNRPMKVYSLPNQTNLSRFFTKANVKDQSLKRVPFPS